MLLPGKCFCTRRNGQGIPVTGEQAHQISRKRRLDRGGLFAFNINQGALSNWAAGGEQNTLGFNMLFNYAIHYRKGLNTWDNFFDIAMGFQNATSFGRFRKTDDRIDITTKYGRQLGKTWYVGFLINFNSQAMMGYDYSQNPLVRSSNFLTPGKLLFSPGFDLNPIKDSPCSFPRHGQDGFQIRSLFLQYGQIRGGFGPEEQPGNGGLPDRQIQ
ncbi:MAG: DUF3078 domain-containing protein [Chitinophagaceae bacterium]|nr:DUF3078 domain-containing protein [Chitinophagaceae bacterium]